MRRMIAAGPPSKRPPHNAFAGGLAWFATVAVVLLHAISAAPAADNKSTLGEFIPVTPPQPAPEVAFTDASGKPAGLGDFAGRPTVVNLWATWCRPCLEEMPSLDRLQARLGGKLTVAAIAEDRKGGDVVNPFVAGLKLAHLTIYLDPAAMVGHALGVHGLPTSFVLDADGRIVGKVEGSAEWDSTRILEALEPLLNGGARSPTHAASGSVNSWAR